MLAIAQIIAVIAALLGVALAPAVGAGAGLTHASRMIVVQQDGDAHSHCDEHDQDGAAVQGGHCCMSAPANLAVEDMAATAVLTVSGAVGPQGDETPRRSPVFGIFKPPRPA